jgi:chromosome segregation ATPase
VTQKEQLAEAQTRITELEGTLATAQLNYSELEVKFTELTLNLTAAQSLVAEQEKQISSFEALTVALTESAETAEAALETEKAEHAISTAQIDELKKSAKSVEELADTRAREIAARNGATVPPKQPGAGDKTVEGNATAGLTGMAKAIAYLNSRQPTPLTV